MKDKDIKKNDINVLVISNILCMECDYNAQKRIGVLEQDTIVFDFIRFEEYFEKEIDYNGIDMAVIWINYESLFPDALISFLSNKDEFERKTSIICDLLKKLYVDVKRRCKGLVFFVGLEDYYIKITQIVGEIPLLGASIDRINLFVMDLLSREDYFVDLKKIISKIGLNNSYNEIWKYRWNATYSQALYFEVWKTIYGRFCSLYRNRIKCIIVDCDNVLWGGILAEDGIESIVLGTDDGRKFQDFQRYILALHYLGVSVCVCSKNNEEEVNEVIDFSKVEVEPLFKDYVDFETFSKSDFRAVKVKECQAVPKSKKLLQFTLDDGTGTDRTILSGIHPYYEPEELIGKTLVAIVNLPPRAMMGIESCGMLLSAIHKEDGEEKLNLLMIDRHIPAGAKLY